MPGNQIKLAPWPAAVKKEVSKQKLHEERECAGPLMSHSPILSIRIVSSAVAAAATTNVNCGPGEDQSNTTVPANWLQRAKETL